MYQEANRLPAPKAPFAPFPPAGEFKPMLASPSSEPPEGPDWINEVKWDGYRAIAIIEQSKVRLLSRNWCAQRLPNAVAWSRANSAMPRASIPVRSFTAEVTWDSQPREYAVK